MPKVRFVSLVCHRPDDAGEADDHVYDISVEDEPYLLAGHKRVWSGMRMNVNDEADLSGVEPVQFKESIGVELWDRDAGPLSEDDQIGRLTVQAHQVGLGELTHELKRKKARYTLTYKVE